MPWYKTGTIAISGTTVTGTGTNWTDNKQGIGPGQALLIPGAGTVKMYEIKSVDSATKITLVSSAGTVAAGQAYAIMSFYTDSIQDFARRLSAQLSYYQSQMDGWQQIMTGSGSITLTAPDGTSVTISSLAKITADMNSVSATANAALPIKGTITTAVDLNSYGPTSDYTGRWYINGSPGYTSTGLPEQQPGIFEVYSGGGFGGMQSFLTRNGTLYTRTLIASWNASSPSWSGWIPVGTTYTRKDSVDLNTLTGPSLLYGNGLVNGPSGTGAQFCFIKVEVNNATPVIQTVTWATANRSFTRSLANGNWSAWGEIYTTNSKPSASDTGALPIDGGTLTGPLTANANSLITANGGLGVALAKGFNLVGAGGAASNDITAVSGNGSTPSTGFVGAFQYKWYNDSWAAGITRGSGTNTLTYSIYYNGAAYGNASRLWSFNYDGTVVSPGAYTNGSDERHKENITPVENSLAAVLSWRGATYDIKDGGEAVGLIAQDVEKWCPRAIKTYGDRTFSDGEVIKDFKNLDTTGVSAAYHTEAIKALFSLVELALVDPDKALASIDAIKSRSSATG